MLDVITIGSATMDVFVECDDAAVLSVKYKEGSNDYMAYPYGAKLEIHDFDSQVGGGGVNTALSFNKLGYKTGAIFKVGNDIYSKGVFRAFENTNVDLSNVIQDASISTGFSIILTSFEGDRTVLAHRGANALIDKKEVNFDAIKNSKFLYVAPLNGDSNKLLDKIVHFAKRHGVYVCCNVGTTGLKKGFRYIKNIISTAQIVVMNKEEASMATGIVIRPDTKCEKFSNEVIHPDIVAMLKKLKVAKTQVIVITDGCKGAYAYNGENLFRCPVFEGPAVSTLGAGDAFASTFCGAMQRTRLDIAKSLTYASVNSASVVSKFSATQGLLKFEEIEERLKNHPDYKCQIINLK